MMPTPTSGLSLHALSLSALYQLALRWALLKQILSRDSWSYMAPIPSPFMPHNIFVLTNKDISLWSNMGQLILHNHRVSDFSLTFFSFGTPRPSSSSFKCQSWETPLHKMPCYHRWWIPSMPWKDAFSGFAHSEIGPIILAMAFRI